MASDGATTLSIMTCNIMTHSLHCLFETLGIKDIQHDNAMLLCSWHYAVRRISFIVMLNAIMLTLIMLNVIMLSVIMPSVIMLRVIMLSVIVLSVLVPYRQQRVKDIIHKFCYS